MSFDDVSGKRVTAFRPRDVIKRLSREKAAWRGRRLLTREGVTVGDGLVLFGVPIITMSPESSISIGSRVILCSSPTYTALGVSRPVILRTLTTQASLRIGDDCGLSGAVIAAATSVQIGDRVLMGADVMIMDTDFHPIDSVPRRYEAMPSGSGASAVVIGDDVFIGARTVVMKGVTIGSGSVIGAGSVVTNSIPSMVVAAGNPCRIIRPLRSASSV